MRELPAIVVAPVDASLREAVMRLRVHPAQQDFVGIISNLLAEADNSRSSEPMAVLHGATPIGFYCIETRSRSIVGRDFGPTALGLRAFFIDADWQGRGWGAQAMTAILADLATRHPAARRLVLTVNCSNHAALTLYRRCGFEDSGELYHGGRAGPQHLLLRALPG
ncbi:GNAT family N-acetyltransferase [Dyella tabacisoli]|uniref:GNAT family N-acetyltransferase n=1 Tax=Dyella tabacisoli TaxID=2282381 RepID=A0A369UN33_9GAMM|nr:GNAT family N-acetyltransferase [Dyella tabacisoli]RDD81020.1 GNAT family N-acetyltransferase [Dyella tabacisoli]